jgi:hypothetical protein
MLAVASPGVVATRAVVFTTPRRQSVARRRRAGIGSPGPRLRASIAACTAGLIANGRTGQADDRHRKKPIYPPHGKGSYR